MHVYISFQIEPSLPVLHIQYNGWVYDRDLTALSLMLLTAYANREISLDYGLDHSGLFDKPEWSKAFRPAKRVAKEKYQRR